jgi:hypothetical protein
MIICRQVAEQKSVLLGREYTNIKYSNELGLPGQHPSPSLQDVYARSYYKICIIRKWFSDNQLQNCARCCTVNYFYLSKITWCCYFNR